MDDSRWLVIAWVLMFGRIIVTKCIHENNIL